MPQTLGSEKYLKVMNVVNVATPITAYSYMLKSQNSKIDYASIFGRVTCFRTMQFTPCKHSDIDQIEDIREKIVYICSCIYIKNLKIHIKMLQTEDFV